MASQSQPTTERGITLRAFALGVVFAGLFAFLTVYWENTPPNRIVTATQIPMLPYMLLFISVLVLNPLLRFARVIRPLSQAEVMIIFVMGAVSSGVSTFGMASQLVPVVSGLYNEHWNNKQSRWDLYVEPFVNEAYFIAEPGIREAAVRHREAHYDFLGDRARLSAARDLLKSEQQLRDSRDALAQAGEVIDPVERAMKQDPLRRQLALAEQSQKRASNRWLKLADSETAADVDGAYPERVARKKAHLQQCKSELDALKAGAFKQIAQFRRGLPEDMRAIPGFIPLTGESATAYFARVKRAMHGGAALGEMRQADQLLAEAAGRDVNAALEARVAAAIEKLAPVADIPRFNRRTEEIGAEQEKLKAQRGELDEELSMLRQRRRFAPSGRFDKLDDEIRKAQKLHARLSRSLGRSDRERAEMAPHLAISAKVAATQEALRGLMAEVRQASPADYPQLRQALAAEAAQFSSFDASWQRFWRGQIDWRIWLRPLANWTVLIFLSYLVLMTFNMLIFRQWAYNEKLIYPLAELPMTLCGADKEKRGLIPELFTSGLFWAGVAVSVFVLSWNVMIAKQWVPGLKAIPLTFKWQEYVQGSIFQGLTQAKFHIFFTLIGLTFLVPAKISHSLWLFHLIFMGQLLLLVWLGYGVNEKSFPRDWNLVLNFRTAEGGGALMVFALAVLWKCRHYLTCALRPGFLSDLPTGERRELQVSSWLFWLGSVALVFSLGFGLGVNLFYAVVCYFIVLIITIGLVRAVAEGGILGFQCWFGPFHLVRSLFGMNRAWTAPSFFAPLMVYYSILFLDIKAFIAPAMANALKVRDDMKLSRWRFHTAIVGGIVCAFIVALLAHIILGYHQGADKMHGWFYAGLPRDGLFGHIKTMAQINPADIAGGQWWLLTGAILMGGLLYFRRRIFWLPHPIGMIMLVNPIMGSYWGSILIGWLAKSLVTKYGNKGTYLRARCFFIGLIVGELLMFASLNRT